MSDAASEDRTHTVRSFDQDLKQLTGLIMRMGGFAEQQVAEALESLLHRDVDIAAKVIERDGEVDSLEEEIDQQVVRILARRQPMAIDLRMVAMALKVTNDLERASDYAVSIAKRAQRLAEQPELLRPLAQLPRMAELSLGMLKEVLDAYVGRDAEKAMQVWHRDKEVDALYTSTFRELITHMLEDPRTISSCIDLLFVAKNIERIGDHATNIAEKVHYMMHGSQINHPRHDA